MSESPQAVLERHVAEGYAPGAVGLIERGGKSEIFAVGRRYFGRPDPVAPDTLFRIASMTKPVTAVAAMILVEEGKLVLDRPVDDLCPELADRRVLRSIDSALDDTVPAARAITLDDVMSFRLGLGFHPALMRGAPIAGAIAELGLPGFGPPDPASPLTPDEFMRRLGTLPLMAQPGAEWLYTLGSNVLGVMVARASGRPLGDFMEERIFAPLGMKDAAFFAPPEKHGRLAAGYRRDAQGQVVLADDPDNSAWGVPPAFQAGDAGLVSTVQDYARFARMLRQDAADSPRILRADSVRAMLVDRLAHAQRAGGLMILGQGRGWGYVGGVADDGTYGWNGGLGTSWTNDPARDMTAILLTQRYFESPDMPAIHREFLAAAARA